MNILHVSCSPRGEASESHRLSQKIIASLRQRAPDAVLRTRVLGAGLIAHVDSGYADAMAAAEEPPGESLEQGSLALSEELIRELEQADAVVIGTPMHNLTVPSALKAWIDHVARVRRTFNVGAAGKAGLLRDRPVYIAIASGGHFSRPHARQPDFLRPYLTAILATLGLQDLHFFSVEGTALGPGAVMEARARSDQALCAHFADQ
jgi:FMN-dependent NADH-azoreductase